MKTNTTPIDRRAVIKGEPSPELVALANELAAVVDRFNNSPEDGPNALTEVSDRIWAEIKAFGPRSIADVLAKSHALGVYCGEGIPKEGDKLTASGRILLQMLADLKRLTEGGPA